MDGIDRLLARFDELALEVRSTREESLQRSAANLKEHEELRQALSKFSLDLEKQAEQVRQLVSKTGSHDTILTEHAKLLTELAKTASKASEDARVAKTIADGMKDEIAKVMLGITTHVESATKSLAEKADAFEEKTAALHAINLRLDTFERRGQTSDQWLRAIANELGLVPTPPGEQPKPTTLQIVAQKAALAANVGKGARGFTIGACLLLALQIALTLLAKALGSN